MNIDPDAITSFSGDYRFLSNFYPASIFYDGLDFPTVEHAYQASKTDSRMHREMIRDAKTPGQAKRMGREVVVRPGFFDGPAFDLMENFVIQKFVKHKVLRELLLRTGERHLVEGNTWRDERWGMVLSEGVWYGENRLGKILMKVRDRIRDGTYKGLE